MGNESPKKPTLPYTSKTKYKPDCIPRRPSVRTSISSSQKAPTTKYQVVRRAHFEDNSSRDQPPAKRFSERPIRNKSKRESADEESDADNDSDNEDDSKSRKQWRQTHCALCEEEQQYDSEPLMECKKCRAKYHLKKCLRYKDELENNLRKTNNLVCPRCIMCAACDAYIFDPANVECSQCCQAWHGDCAPPGHRTTQDYDSPWICSKCCRIKNIRELNSPKLQEQIVIQNFKTRKQKKEVREKREFAVNIEEIEEKCNQKALKMDSLIKKISIEQPSSVLSMRNKREKRRKSVHGEYDYSKPHHGENFPISIRKEMEIYERARREPRPPTPSTNDPPIEQYLHFGDGKSCKTVYPSVFEEPLKSARHIYVCKFCLYKTSCQDDMIVHWNTCVVWHPPGTEIYRDDNISFFEVEGTHQLEYCRSLCLLAKLFIASKTLYDEVQTFNFYVLCEKTTEGFVILGYFSKEHYPEKNNNLSCLLVFPTLQRKGYGRLLIDMSYELSRIEHKVGHPENPLSDLGTLAYQGYWRSSILCYIREHRKSERHRIHDICLATRIWSQDILHQLVLDNILTFDDGTFNIKIDAKRALKFPLSQIRRQCIDSAKLMWKPKRAKNPPLDPTQINTYNS